MKISVSKFRHFCDFILKRSGCFIFLSFYFSVNLIHLTAQTIKIETPFHGFTTKRVQTISGTVTDYDLDKIILIINGIPQSARLQNNHFSSPVVVAPGENIIEARAGNAMDRVSFFAKVPGKDIKVVLTWDSPTDVDLWVIDPQGEKCYYQNKSTKNGGNLDIDITNGYGPETFTMAKALAGSFAVQVQYYSAYQTPVTRVKVFVVLYEGASNEQRKSFEFVMTKPHQVYQIGNFIIDQTEN